MRNVGWYLLATCPRNVKSLFFRMFLRIKKFILGNTVGDIECNLANQERSSWSRESLSTSTWKKEYELCIRDDSTAINARNITNRLLGQFFVNECCKKLMATKFDSC